MKIIEFLKGNISVFNVAASVFLILFIVFVFGNKFNDHDNHMIGFLLAFAFLGISILFLLFDFIGKKIIKNRLNLNFLELSILILIYIYYSFTYN